MWNKIKLLVPLIKLSKKSLTGIILILVIAREHSEFVCARCGVQSVFYGDFGAVGECFNALFFNCKLKKNIVHKIVPK